MQNKENDKIELDKSVFNFQPANVDFCCVDYDGRLRFGKAGGDPRYTWSSERWRGFDQIGESIKGTNYKPRTSLKRH